MCISLLGQEIIHAESPPTLHAESPPLSRKSYAESPPFCMLNHPPPKPVRFAFKFYLYLFPIARAQYSVDNLPKFINARQEQGTPLGFPHLRRLPLPHKDKPPVRLESLARYAMYTGTQTARGKAAASRIGLLRRRGRVSLSLHS